MSADWDQASNILCVRLDSLGDVLMCTPAMRAVRGSAPGRALTLLTSPGGAAVAPFIPELDAVIDYQAPWMKSSAAHEHGIDLRASWMIGDILHDVEAGNRAGCRTVLLDKGNETEWRLGPRRIPTRMAPDLYSAAVLIASHEHD